MLQIEKQKKISKFNYSQFKKIRRLLRIHLFKYLIVIRVLIMDLAEEKVCLPCINNNKNTLNKNVKKIRKS